MAPFYVLVYLFPTGRSNELVGCNSAKYRNDAYFLSFLCEVLQDVRTDNIWHKLVNYLPLKGRPDDVVNPFGDRSKRGDVDGAVYMIDISQDSLIHINYDGRRRIPLSSFQQPRLRAITLSDFKLFGPTVLPPPIVHLNGPFWTPQVQVCPRICALTHRLLRDFDARWRHVFCSDYTTNTIRYMARAIIRIATLDFKIQGVIKPDFFLDVKHPWPFLLPTWEPFPTITAFRTLGSVVLVVCESISVGLIRARQHAFLSSFERKQPRPPGLPDYLILSIRHILLARSTAGGTDIEYTAPLPLFAGMPETAPLSDLALDYLLWAISAIPPAPHTRLHTLPIEFQHRILSYIPARPLAKAHLGAVLGLGLPFLWKTGAHDVAAMGEVAAQDVHITDMGVVDEHVRFEDCEVGLMYRNMAPRDAGRVESGSRGSWVMPACAALILRKLRDR